MQNLCVPAEEGQLAWGQRCPRNKRLFPVGPLEGGRLIQTHEPPAALQVGSPCGRLRVCGREGICGDAEAERQCRTPRAKAELPDRRGTAPAPPESRLSLGLSYNHGPILLTAREAGSCHCHLHFAGEERRQRRG